MCVPGTSPKHVWASYSRPDAHRGPRTLEIVAPTQIQWQNHVNAAPLHPVVTKGSTATPTKVGGDTVGFKTPNATSKAALGRRQRRDGLVGKRLSIFIEVEAT